MTTSREELIAETNALLDELEALDVNIRLRERRFVNLTSDELAEELDCRRDQLNQRKKFLGEP